MEIEVQDLGWRVVRASGDIDLSNVERFRSALDTQAQASPEGFVIDLSAADYVDSAGIQALIRAYKALRVGQGSLALVLGETAVRDLVKVVHLDALPGMYVLDDVQSAVAVLAGRCSG